MISWPWDGVEIGFDSETGFPILDREYTAEELREVLMTFFSNGVFMEQANAFTPKAGNGMEITISPGRCFIQGDVGVENSTRTMVFKAASSQDRYDTVVLRWDNNLEARHIELYVKQGTAAAKPVRPGLTRGESVWELGLCDVFIPAGTTSISQSRITDTRLETARCGSVQPFQTIDTSTFFYQIQEEVDRAVKLAEAAIDGTLFGQLEDAIKGKVSKSGDTMTGNLNIQTGTTKGKGSDNGFTGDITTGSINVGDNVNIRTDNEGGNIRIFSPSGIGYEQDAYDGGYRLFQAKDGNASVFMSFNESGTPQFPSGNLPVSSGGTGRDTPKGAANALLGGMNTESGDFGDGSYIAGVYGSSTDSNGAIYKRPASGLWNYIQGKGDARYVNKTGDTMSGNLSIQKGDASLSLIDTYENTFRIHVNGSASGNAAFWIYNASKKSNALSIGQESNKVSFAEPLDVSSGGTGSSDSRNARRNIGVFANTVYWNTSTKIKITPTNNKKVAYQIWGICNTSGPILLLAGGGTESSNFSLTKVAGSGTYTFTQGNTSTSTGAFTITASAIPYTQFQIYGSDAFEVEQV